MSDFNVPVFKVKHLPIVLKYFVPILKDIHEKGDTEPFSVILSEHIENIINAIVELGIAEREWLEDQPPSVLLDIIKEIIEVNADFFTEAAKTRGDVPEGE